MLGRLRQRGDTLIEVLFAVSIFSAVAVGTIVIMNQGISTAQNALEINLVRNQIDSQAELLRHLNDAKLGSIGRNTTDDSLQWDEAVRNASAQADDYNAVATFDDCKPQTLPASAFFVDPKTGKVVRNQFVVPSTFAQIQLAPGGTNSISNMIWVQPVQSASSEISRQKLTNTTYYDFHIRACWDSSGAGSGVIKLGTIVRLYVPKQ